MSFTRQSYHICVGIRSAPRVRFPDDRPESIGKAGMKSIIFMIMTSENRITDKNRFLQTNNIFKTFQDSSFQNDTCMHAGVL